MNKKYVLGNLAFFLFIISLPLFCLQEGRGKGRVFGTVTDQNGNPIEGAHIIVESIEYNFSLEATSNEKGNWAIMGVGNGMFLIKASKEGYLPSETQTRLSNFQNPKIDFELKSIEESGVQAVQGREASRQLYREAMSFYDDGKYMAALELYRSFLEKNPTLFQVGINIGNCYREMGEYQKALEEYQTVLKKLNEQNDTLEGNEDAARVLTNIGETYMLMEEIEEATSYFEQAIDIFPKDHALAYNIAEIYFNRNQVEKAIEMYSLAIKINPEMSEAYLKKGYALLNIGEYKAAKETLQKYIDLDPQAPEAPAVEKLIEELEKMIK